MDASILRTAFLATIFVLASTVAQAQKPQGVMGVVVQQLSPEDALRVGLQQGTGVLVTTLVEDGPAAKAGVRIDDVITALDGMPLAKRAQFYSAMDNKSAGQRVHLTIRRGTSTTTVSIVLAPKPTTPASQDPTFRRLQSIWLQLESADSDSPDDAEKLVSGGTEGLLLIPSVKIWPNENSLPFLKWAFSTSLATGLLNRRSGDRKKDIEKAVELYQVALSGLSRSAATAQWSATQKSLGDAYAKRIVGDRAENLERALEAYESALAATDRAVEPGAWSDLQKAIALTYRDRIRGARNDNIEAALKAIDASLTVISRETAPKSWAQHKLVVGQLYANRLKGDREQNLESAIAAYEAALAATSERDDRRMWGTLQDNLGLAYSDRRSGDRLANVERAIQAFKDALATVDKRRSSDRWAMSQSNLGRAYLARRQGNADVNRLAAMSAFEAALKALNKEINKELWATIQTNLGATYFMSASAGAHKKYAPLAIKALRSALSVTTVEGSPREFLRRAKTLGEILMIDGQWEEARRLQAQARTAFSILFGSGLEEVEASAMIKAAGELYVESAEAALEQGDHIGGFAFLEEGRARKLAIALREDGLSHSPTSKARLVELREAIRTEELKAEQADETGTAALKSLVSLRRELSAVVGTATTTVEAVTGFLSQTLNNASAVVAPIVSTVGKPRALIATRRDGNLHFVVVPLPDLGKEQLLMAVRGTVEEDVAGGWLNAFFKQHKATALAAQIELLSVATPVDHDAITRLSAERESLLSGWTGAIDAIGPDLWGLFVGRVDAALKEALIQRGQRIVLLPTGALGLLPLGLAQNPTSGERWGETYEIVVAPSLRALSSSSNRVESRPNASLAIVVNPAGERPDLALPFTEVEGAIIASRFPFETQKVLDKTTANVVPVLQALDGRDYWHFSSHGVFDWKHPRRSGLLLRNGEVLSIERLLDSRSVSKPRLVVLSACETGLYDIDGNAEEFLGLPAAFLQAGAAGVVGTLWQVDDLATALLVTKFYELHIDQQVAPSTALKAAQHWLRSSTTEQLTAFAQQAGARAKLGSDVLAELDGQIRSRTIRGRGAPADATWVTIREQLAPAVRQEDNDERRSVVRPFEHPYYWGGFVYTGL